MTEPQVWTLIGVFGSVLLAMFATTSGYFVRVLRAEIGGLRGEMRAEIGGLRGEMRAEIGGLRGEMRAEIDGLRREMGARFEAVDERFGRVDTRLDYLDRDVQILTKHVFGERD